MVGLWLSKQASPWVGQVPFRAAGAAVTAFVLSLLIGRWLIRRLRRRRVYEDISEPDSARIEELRRGKENTPTMGGLIILSALLLATALWCNLLNFYVLMAVFTMLALGALGLADDHIKRTQPESRGLRRRAKLMFQLALGVLVGVALWRHTGHSPLGGRLILPGFWNLGLDLGKAYILLAAVVMAGASNAVNLTDGLDGLAAGCSAVTGLTLAAAAYLVGRPGLSESVGIPYVPGTAELAVFCAGMVGAVLGFLWYNCHPAEIFMGDTGSLPLGGLIGWVALALKFEALLLLLAVVFVVELASVALQIGWFKMTRRRIFRCAPIHHHFQFLGWPETKVTVRFWIIAAIVALASVAALRLP